jgi:hypothetical protein
MTLAPSVCSLAITSRSPCPSSCLGFSSPPGSLEEGRGGGVAVVRDQGQGGQGQGGQGAGGQGGQGAGGQGARVPGGQGASRPGGHG